MSAMKVGSYETKIRRITKCSAEDAAKIKQIMRDDILHTAALDWLTVPRFEMAALGAARLLDANRVAYEEYFATAGRMFDEMKAAGSANR